MRCLTLADAIRRRDGIIRFISRHMPDHLLRLVTQHGHEFVALEGQNGCATSELPYSEWLGTTEAADAEATRQALRGESWDLLVVDHYALSARWETALRDVAKRILVIDDLAEHPHDCDLLLDQNDLSADRCPDGKLPAHCRLLLGPKYALLREEFQQLHEQVEARSGNVRRMLIFMGGMDTGNHTAQAIEALDGAAVPDLEVDVVIGKQHPHREQIESACAIRGYRCHVQTSGMAQLIAAADLAIGSGGSAAWERCCLGLPALTLCVADNQERLIESAAMNGLLYAARLKGNAVTTLAHHLQALLDNPIILQSMSRNGLRTVDGRGTERVLRALGCSRLSIREATRADSGDILSWRNHPAVRAVSRNTDVIDQAVHQAWFESVLTNPDRVVLIGETGGQPVGVARFDIAEGEARISIFLAPGLSGRGLGSELLTAAEDWLIGHRQDVRRVVAEVLGANQSSHALFQAGDYRSCSTVYVKRLDGQ